MAIRSGFVRETRCREVEGCPLLPALPTHVPASDERACAACPFNALWPGHARVGCVIETRRADYEAAMDRLRALAPDRARSLERLLAQGREDEASLGLPRAALGAVLEIAQGWATLAGSSSDERGVIAVLIAFASAGLRLQEPIQLLA